MDAHWPKSRGSRFAPLLYAAQAGALLLLPLLVLALAKNPQDAYVWIALEVGLLLCGVLFMLVRSCCAAPRLLVEDLVTGFRVSGPQGARFVSDDEITDVRWYRSSPWTKFLWGYETSFTFWTEDDRRPCEIVADLDLDGNDPQAALWTRIVARLTVRAQANWRKGGRISGDRWLLDTRALEVQRWDGRWQFELREIGSLTADDQRIRIWLRDHSQSCCSLPQSSRNAPVLRAMLEDTLAGRIEPGLASPEVEPPLKVGSFPPLGPVRDEVRVFDTTIQRACLAVILSGAACLPILAAVLAFGILCDVYFPALVPLLIVVGSYLFGAFLICWFVGIPLGMVSQVLAWSSLVVHEGGITLRGWSWERTLAWDELSGFQYADWGGAWVNPSAAWTTMEFRPWPRGGRRSIRIYLNDTFHQDVLQRLRDRLAAKFQTRFEALLEQGHSVVWTPHLLLHSDGLEVRRRPWFGRPRSVFVPYREVSDLALRGTKYQIWSELQSSPVAVETSRAENFFGGQRVFERLVKQSRKSEGHDFDEEKMPVVEKASGG